MKNNQVQQLSDWLSEPRKIVITTHVNPDGDAMGSALGLFHFLEKKKHQVTVVLPNMYPDFLSWMPGAKKSVVFEEDPKKAKTLVHKADIIFTLDFNNLSRIEALGEEVKKSPARVVMVDHHLQPADYADLAFWDTTASSTCQLIFELIENLGEKKAITANIANCLYTGIMTDTGSFRFESTTPQVHRVIADLIEAGARKTMVHEQIFDGNSEDRMRLWGYSLLEKLTVYEDYKTAFIALASDELVRFGHRPGDTEGLVNQALSIKGIKLAAFFMEKEDQIKISFRSKGDFDVNTFARKHFNGGGHKNAAGGRSDLTLDETILEFTKVIRDYKTELSGR